MRNIDKKIFVLLVAAAVCSCGKEVMPGSISGRRIVPVVTGEAVTKAEDAAALGILKSNGFTMDIIADAAYDSGDAGLYGERRTVSWSGVSWSISGEPKWINDTQMSFWAYNTEALTKSEVAAPSAGAASVSFTYPKSGVTPDAQTDLMFAYTNKTHLSTNVHESGTSYDEVSLTFKHAMSKIDFDQNSISGMPSGYSIASITLSGLKTGGDASYGSSGYTWTNLDGSSSFSVTSTGGMFLVVPQNGKSATIDIRLTHPTESPTLLSSTLANHEMEAGKRYTYRISIDATRNLVLTMNVLPWDSEVKNLEIKEQAVSQQLVYDNVHSVVDNAAKTVTIKNGQPVRGSFQLSSPKGAKLLLALDGNLNAFEVSPKTTTIGNDPVNFTVTPLVSDPKVDYKTQLHIYLVHSDASVSELDEAVMGTDNNYTIILPKQ